MYPFDVEDWTPLDELFAHTPDRLDPSGRQGEVNGPGAFGVRAETMSKSTRSDTNQSDDRTALVVGAGLVGTLCAAMLASGSPRSLGATRRG
jgi:threonine dehydrogenase-like Zn-dependent dehydrogenase